MSMKENFRGLTNAVYSMWVRRKGLGCVYMTEWITHKYQNREIVFKRAMTINICFEPVKPEALGYSCYKYSRIERTNGLMKCQEKSYILWATRITMEYVCMEGRAYSMKKYKKDEMNYPTVHIDLTGVFLIFSNFT